MAEMTLNEYQKLASRTTNHDKVEMAFGLSEEAGELQGVIKKHLRHGHPLNKDKFIKEAGDLLWYLSTNADEYGITLEEIAKTNIEKLKERYPDGFTEEDSIKRVDVEEKDCHVGSTCIPYSKSACCYKCLRLSKCVEENVPICVDSACNWYGGKLDD